MLWPKCSAEMTEGFIDNAKCPLYRKPQGYEEDIFSFHSGKHGGKLQLGDGGYLLGGCVTAFYCSACDLVLIDDIRHKLKQIYVTTNLPTF